jgi:hypothetical protein
MNTIELHIYGAENKIYKIQFPETWEELTTDQVEVVAHFRFNFNVFEDAAVQKLLIDLLGLKKRALKEVMDLLLDETQDVSILDLYSQIDWIKGDVSIKKDIYLPPAEFTPIGERYENIRAKQFYFIEHLYQEYRLDRTESNLELLLAATYPIGLFNEQNIEHNAEILKTEPIAVKQGLLLNFLGQRKQFTLDYEILFPEDEPDKIDESEEAETNFFDMYQDVLFQLPNEKFGDINKIPNTPIRLVFDFLENNKKNAKTQPNG